MIFEFLRLLAGTVVYRPYVYVFLLCFLTFALRHLRVRGTLSYMVLSFVVAFLSEYSSTRNGFPFGLYTYIDTTRTRELWISNVPFWDSLSFVFLSYFSWILAAGLLSPQAPSRALLRTPTALLGGLLMMLLDIVIDPVTLQGEHWFLGRIYFYPNGGSYFGVTLSNFAGWFWVGTFTLFLYQRLALIQPISALLIRQRSWRPLTSNEIWAGFGVYAGIFAFNLGIALWIRRWDLFAAGLVVTLATLSPALWILGRRRVSPAWEGIAT